MWCCKLLPQHLRERNLKVSEFSGQVWYKYQISGQLHRENLSQRRRRREQGQGEEGSER